MGGYGVLRVCYPVCPDAGYELAWLVCGLGTLSMVYGAWPPWPKRTSSGWWPTAPSATWATCCWASAREHAVAGLDFRSDYWRPAASAVPCSR